MLLLVLYYVMLLGIPLTAAFTYLQRGAASLIPFIPTGGRQLLRQSSTSLSSTIPHSDSVNSNNISTIHLIVLVHGWLGNPLEMGYLQDSFIRQLRSKQSSVSSIKEEKQPAPTTVPETDPCADNYLSLGNQAFFIHSAQCNSGKTTDGIAAGGQRLAQEIQQIMQQRREQQQNLSFTLSIVGNSLGGLYARYALKELRHLFPSMVLLPKFFVTTCTPHLGVSRHTYIRLPRLLEVPIAYGMLQTGQDLFRCTSVLQDMTTQSEYLEPLQQFQNRMAWINVYGTDFQVPTPTSGFWGRTDSKHVVVTRPNEDTADSVSNVILQLETPVRQQQPQETDEAENSSYLTCEELSVRLDALGWTKVLVDVRQHLPVTGRFFQNDKRRTFSESHKKEWTAQELLDEFDDQRFRSIPLGHTVMVANSKDKVNQYLTQGGKTTMDHLAKILVEGLSEGEDKAKEPQRSSVECNSRT